jgi:phosphoserine phosphatase RsbU/P
LRQLNDSLQERKMDAQYVTMVFAVWNDEKQTLQIANAGAVQPLFCRGGQVETVQAEGFPLGMFKDVNYEEFTLSTRPGDAIIFFSDGIVDAVNDKEEMFGDARLTALVTSHIKSTAQEMVDAIYQELSTFQGGVERFDDETVIVLKVLPGPG